jgi:hypothetical protein
VRNSRALAAGLMLIFFGLAAAGMLVVAPLAAVRRAPDRAPTPTPTATATPSPTATPTPTPAPKPASCIGPHEVPYFYANSSNKENPWSFGPSAEPYGPRTLAQLKRELTQRLCGTATHGGDMRLYVALRAVVFGYSNPNVRITHKQWERGVPELLAMFSWDYGTSVHRQSGERASMSMEPKRPHGDPTVHAAESKLRSNRILKLGVNGPNSVFNRIDLRLRCGFQPVLSSRSSLPAALRR